MPEVSSDLATLGGSGWVPTNNPKYGGAEVVRRATWTTLPLPSTVTGQIFRVTDVGVAGVGMLVISDGTSWCPLGPQVLARSNTAASVTGTTNETTLATITVPAGLMGLNGTLRVLTEWDFTNSGNLKSPRVRFGGAEMWIIGPSANTGAGAFTEISNAGSASSQFASLSTTSGLSTGSTGTRTTSALNTAADVSLTITGQLALGSETLTLKRYRVEALP